jgi:GTP-binding protein
MSFTVVIAGRPNVGKSTLFNRLLGKAEALVDRTPGVTRDWREGEGRIGPLRFRVIDTGGYEGGHDLAAQVRAQTERALGQADLALLLLDGRAGVTPLDEEFAVWLRRHDIAVLAVVNKCESPKGHAGIDEAFALGFGDPVAISALHGAGMGDLYDALLPYAPSAEPGEEEEEGEDAPLRLAVIGRPNVGKSTLVNRLIREERVITGPEPGITREAIAIRWKLRGREIELVDTAGVRKPARVTTRLEKLSIGDTLKAIDFAHVVLLVMDAHHALEKQDLVLGAHAVEEGRALVIAANKWDLITNRREALKELKARLAETLPQVKDVPVIALSALTGQGVSRLLPAVLKAEEIWCRRISTGRLNRWLSDATTRHPPPMVAGRRLKLRYVTQVKTRPPTFALFASRPEKLPRAYRRYLVNGLREAFGLVGVPLRLLLRRGENPYAKKA